MKTFFVLPSPLIPGSWAWTTPFKKKRSCSLARSSSNLLPEKNWWENMFFRCNKHLNKCGWLQTNKQTKKWHTNLKQRWFSMICTAWVMNSTPIARQLIEKQLPLIFFQHINSLAKLDSSLISWACSNFFPKNLSVQELIWKDFGRTSADFLVFGSCMDFFPFLLAVGKIRRFFTKVPWTRRCVALHTWTVD